MRVGRVLLGLAAVVVLGGGAFLALAWRSAIDPVEPPDRASFDPARVTKGAELAAVGDCGRCHTVEGGAAYAGGYPLATPFGTIYATNITPDPETGIGRWSEAAFRRAMREGVDREGRHLYPAFPYDHFAQASDEDLTAVYAFLMTRDPVRATAPPDQLAFPYNVRPLLAGWNLLFLDKAPFRPDPGRDAAWNRGAYLAESLGHCGACHTPRNKLGAEEKDRPYAGGEAEGWSAPALDASSPAPVRWTEADLLRLPADRLQRAPRPRRRADGAGRPQPGRGAGGGCPRHRRLRRLPGRPACPRSGPQGRGDGRLGRAASAPLPQDGRQRGRRSGCRGLRQRLRHLPPRGRRAAILECVKFCKWAVALGPAGWVKRPRGAGASSAPEVVHVQVAVRFQPVLVSLDGQRAHEP